MEDCGGSPPDGDVYNLNYFAQIKMDVDGHYHGRRSVLEPVVLLNYI